MTMRNVIHLEMPEVMPEIPQPPPRKKVMLEPVTINTAAIPDPPKYTVLKDENEVVNWMAARGTMPNLTTGYSDLSVVVGSVVEKVCKDMSEDILTLTSTKKLLQYASSHSYKEYFMQMTYRQNSNGTTGGERFAVSFAEAFSDDENLTKYKSWVSTHLNTKLIAVCKDCVYIALRSGGCIEVQFNTDNINEDYSDLSNTGLGGAGRVMEVLLQQAIGFKVRPNGTSYLPVYAGDGTRTLIGEVERWLGKGHTYAQTQHTVVVDSILRRMASTYYSRNVGDMVPSLVNLKVYLVDEVVPDLRKLCQYRYPLAHYLANFLLEKGHAGSTTDISIVDYHLRRDGIHILEAPRELIANWALNKRMSAKIDLPLLISESQVPVKESSLMALLSDFAKGSRYGVSNETLLNVGEAGTIMPLLVEHVKANPDKYI